MKSDTNSSPQHVSLQQGQFEHVRDILASYSGVYLDQTSQRVLSSGVGMRLAATGMTLTAYLSYLSQEDARPELQQLSELVLNHETVFFRNQPHMQALRQVILPQFHRQKPSGEPLRIWSAGCSTGEEPYSLAIMALETLGRPLPRPVEIWATDLSSAALAKSRVGCYHGRTLTNVTPEIRQRYFHYRGGAWAVTEEVRSLVTFEQVNLLEPFPANATSPNSLDMIFCQNVTIYFDLPTFRSLVDRFYQILPDGGILFLGFSETLWNIYDKFRLREVAGAFLYTKEPPTPLPPRPSLPPSSVQTRVRPRSSGVSSRPGEQGNQEAPPRMREHQHILEPQRSSPKPEPAVYTKEPDESVIERCLQLLDAGRVEEVLDILYKVPLNGPQAPQGLALLARAHANRGDMDLAVAEARRAIELDSLTTEAYLLLGVLYAQQGQMVLAAKQLERARYLDPESPLISFHLAESYRQLQRNIAALREYRNTLNKLSTYAQDTLLDGVAVGWLRESCERYLTILANNRR
jgi:chemotaxis protein methyltransferase CheR